MRSLFRTFSLGLICLLLIASNDAAVNVYGYGSGSSSVTEQGTSVVTIYPTAYQTPNSQGGWAINSPSNTGGSASLSITNMNANETCTWYGFPSVSGQIVSARLKMGWSASGSVSGPTGGGGGFTLAYTGGSVGASLSNNSQSSSVDFLLPAGQDLTQVQVSMNLGGGAGPNTTFSANASVSNIRIEVEVVCIASVSADHWKGEYYNNTNPSGSPAMVRDDGAGFLDFNFGSGGPGSVCVPGVDNFSARWTRTVNFSAGTYRFIVTVDDGARLYIDGLKIIDAWGIQAPTTYTGDASLSAGSHEIKLEYFESGGGASISLFWGAINCPASVPAGRWRGEYFNNITVSGIPAMVRDDGADFLNFDFGLGSPAAACGLGVDNFSIRWTRTVNFAASTYRFSVTGDDGVRLYVDEQIKIDKWLPQGATTYTADVALSAGAHEVKLEYFEGGGPGIALLSWVDATGVNCLPNVPLPLISSVPQAGGRENIASTAPSQAPKRCGQ
jgi:hypothetical protein